MTGSIIHTDLQIENHGHRAGTTLYVPSACTEDLHLLAKQQRLNPTPQNLLPSDFEESAADTKSRSTIIDSKEGTSRTEESIPLLLPVPPTFNLTFGTIKQRYLQNNNAHQTTLDKQ